MSTFREGAEGDDRTVIRDETVVQRGGSGVGAVSGGDVARTDHEASVVRHEEELDVSTRVVETGHVRAVKSVESHLASDTVPRDVEHADVERVAAVEGDSGRIEELPDGSVSIPVFEEELVVTKRRVLRERIIIRKRVVTEHERIEAELLRERVEIEGDVDTGTGTGTLRRD